MIRKLKPGTRVSLDGSATVLEIVKWSKGELETRVFNPRGGPVDVIFTPPPKKLLDTRPPIGEDSKK